MLGKQSRRAGFRSGDRSGRRVRAKPRPQCDEDPSSLLLVAKRIDTTKTTMITGTTKKGEVMCMAETPSD